ncbi:LamG-like jellyroll fold domain-containing protein [Rubritalea tangerina]|uniref:LamG-like jellyroll fold domain-containing protein n=1 Tax=Rubritalea tangerina TaxID=430798 RepID=A0ABW4ZEE8_9BACT
MTHKFPSLLVLLSGALIGASQAAITDWMVAAAATSGNVTVSNNGGAGFTFDGTSGIAYDFGELDALGGKPVDGSTVEFIINFADSGPSLSIATVTGWSPGNEKNQFKLEQWNNTGKFGITWEGFADYSFNADSVFNQDVHVVFRRNNSGTIDLFLDGAYVETDTGKTNWRMDGGLGMLGARSNGTTDVATGDMHGVASYDTALSNAEISNLYAAFTAIPEPSSISLLGLGGLSLLLRRRR